MRSREERGVIRGGGGGFRKWGVIKKKKKIDKVRGNKNQIRGEIRERALLHENSVCKHPKNNNRRDCMAPLSHRQRPK